MSTTSQGRSVQERLRDHGFRVTPQRATILEILSEVVGHQHLTAQEVFGLAQDRLPGLNVATVYRSLVSLTDAGLVEQMVTSADGIRFSLKDPQHQHCHLVCRVCSQVLEFDSAELGTLSARIEQSYGFAIDIPHLTFPGVCSGCQQSHKHGH
jgi:Fur family ferric uptake transcriptional regulator